MKKPHRAHYQCRATPIDVFPEVRSTETRFYSTFNQDIVLYAHGIRIMGIDLNFRGKTHYAILCELLAIQKRVRKEYRQWDLSRWKNKKVENTLYIYINEEFSEYFSTKEITEQGVKIPVDHIGIVNTQTGQNIELVGAFGGWILKQNGLRLATSTNWYQFKFHQRLKTFINCYRTLNFYFKE